MHCNLSDKRDVTARKLCDGYAVAIDELQLSVWDARISLPNDALREPASVSVEAS
jgi:hypothetical protein